MNYDIRFTSQDHWIHFPPWVELTLEVISNLNDSSTREVMTVAAFPVQDLRCKMCPVPLVYCSTSTFCSFDHGQAASVGSSLVSQPFLWC